MGANNNESRFVVTFPLKTELWQEHKIDKILRMLTVLYNDKQRMMLGRYIHLSRTPEFKDAKKAGLNSFKKYMSDQGFSERAFEKVFYMPKKNETNEQQKNDTSLKQQLLLHGINSCIVQELSKRAWSAFDKKLYGNGKHILVDNVVSTFKSRVKNGTIIGFKYSMVDYTITMTASKPKNHDLFTIPFVVNRNSDYELFALNEELRNIAITRKIVRGKNKYYVQFTFAGIPYNKGRQLGEGVVGIDPGPSKIAVVSDTAVRIIPLAESIERDERETRRLQRKLDRSRRAMNPDNYNEDGTISKGRHEWVKSHHYEETRSLLADRQRKLAAKRKIAHNELANELLAMGNEFRVEKNSFKSMQARAKETTKNTKGKNNSKKRFGKSIANRAPSEFLTILENKLRQYENGVYVDIPASTACTQYDFTSGEFTKHKWHERTITTSDGQRHNRDALAAFNMKFVHTDKVAGKNKIEKSEDNFDNESMAAFYPRFCQMESNI